ncbi:hypothetical protein MSG28_003927 [Choristoneura fumiferana]|uniref:Uncharacterized protein n=1 Tax=Choristoneura fumiferana TaxID=7141 RepID=A0ACC0KGP7_CHOFU|nr:hypothetical protein MSG28_003927 [Choristoneura fumiferana]
MALSDAGSESQQLTWPLCMRLNPQELLSSSLSSKHIPTTNGTSLLPSGKSHKENLDLLKCSWIRSKTEVSVVNQNLTFLVNGKAVAPFCQVKEDNGIVSSCTWSASKGFPLYRQQLETYFFKMKSCNLLGCINENFTIDHFSIVKPNKPTDLEVLQNGTHSVVLKWKIPNNMVDLLGGGIEHRVEYQIAEIDDTSYFHKVDASELPPKNRTYKFALTNLPYAHKEYEVRIYIRPKKAKQEQFWSDYAFKIINTTSEIPQRPPETAAGAFHQMPYDNHRLINVYWSQLWDYEEAGANFTYKVVVLQGKKSETLFPENKSLSYISLINATLDSLQVSVWSQNAVGTSKNYSSLYIPPKVDTDTLTLKSFTKLKHINGTYELSWNKINNIDNYTLFWCELNTTNTCTDHMNMTTLQPNVSKHSIYLPQPNAYQFAISANNGTKSSGMTWAKCDIAQGQIGLFAYPVTLRRQSVGTNFINLTWNIDCAFPDGFLKGYNIIYCPIIDTTASCENNKNETIKIFDLNQKSYKVENLLPYRTYLFRIVLNTTYGITVQNDTLSDTTLEDTPTEPIDVRIDYITDTSVNISWKPPVQTNGKISTYNIILKSLQGTIQKDVEETHFQATSLQYLTNYTVYVQACNYIAKVRCSRNSPHNGVHFRTRIGSPDKISTPLYNNTLGIIQWFVPRPVDLYQVRILRDDEELSIHNTTDLAIEVKQCEGSVLSYQVRGINFDYDLHHGVLGDPEYVKLPEREDSGKDEYISDWSEKYTVPCGETGSLTLTLIIMAVLTLVGVAYGSLKLYRKIKQMEDIKPVFPNGLSVPEKDLTKYGFGGWSQTNKDEKPSSDEMLLLPSSKTSVSPNSNGIKQNSTSIDNCDASDHTDSTALSNDSRAPIDRQSSLSDNGSDSSLHLEVEQIQGDDNVVQRDSETSISESESSRESSPYLNDQAFKKNPTSGYVQSVMNPNTGAIQPAPVPFKSPPHQTKPPVQPPSTSYVMAGLSPPIFTTGLMPTKVSSQLPASGYVRAEDAQARSMNFPKLGPSPTKLFGPESLPTLPNLPPPSKTGVENSYIQLQSLESLPNMKGSVVAAPSVALPKPATSGYVSPGDAVISKHLSHMLARTPDSPAILSPDMSPDAYCRFSWSTDPNVDNFNSILVDSSVAHVPQN